MDLSAIGSTGVVMVATQGAAGPGEVQLSLNGDATHYTAWSPEPLAKGTAVIAVELRDARTVEVRPSAASDLFS